MHRSLMRCVRVYLNQCNLDVKTNRLTRNISSSSCCNKKSQGPTKNDPDEGKDVPRYVETRYRKLSKPLFIGFLTTKLLCPPQRASEICTYYPKFSEKTVQDVHKNVNFLTLKDVTQESILDNPWILTLNHAHLKSNIEILEEMQPKNINDFVPLAIIPSEKLKKIQEIAKEEANIIPNNHRVYYFSELLHMSPCTVSQYASSRLFILRIPFDKLDSRMKVLLKFIAPEKIVNHLSSLKLSAPKIESRLAQAKESHYSIKRSNLARAILGERSLAQYYSDRLKVDIEVIESMLQQYPELKKFSTPLIAEKLDYLLNEVGITASEIVQSPYMLTKSLVTTKKRIQELQSHGCARNLILSFVFQNSKRYEKFLTNQLKKTGDE